jgi:hypothetical protein
VKKSKRCIRCKKRKPVSCFSKLRRSPDKLNCYCRECQRKANRACWVPYYAKHRKRLLSVQKEKQRNRTKDLAKLKSVPCADCHKKYPFYVMDFDHVRGKKKFIMGRCGNLKWKRVLKEIAKCDVVCANCHRTRTYKRRQV